MERHICAGILHEPAHTNLEWFESLQTSSNASKNDIKTDRSLQGPVTVWLLNFLYAETSIPRRRYKDTIRMRKAGEELKNLVTRSLPLESLVALGRRINPCVKTFVAFSPDPADCPWVSEDGPIRSPWHYFLYQLPVSPHRLSPVIDLTWLARMVTWKITGATKRDLLLGRVCEYKRSSFSKIGRFDEN